MNDGCMETGELANGGLGWRLRMEALRMDMEFAEHCFIQLLFFCFF